MDKAYVDFAALYRMQIAGAFFVTRAKSPLKYEVTEQNFNIDLTTGLRTDKTVALTVTKSKKLYPDQLRLVEYYDAEKDMFFVFLSNNFEVSALEIARLYKNRRQIEIFQVDKTEPCHQKTMGTFPECNQKTYLEGYLHLSDSCI